MNTQAARATANANVEMYSSLTPNLKIAVGRLYPNTLPLAYRVQSGELQEPKRIDRERLELFFDFLTELHNVLTRQFQRGCNSKHLIQITLNNLGW